MNSSSCCTLPALGPASARTDGDLGFVSGASSSSCPAAGSSSSGHLAPPVLAIGHWRIRVLHHSERQLRLAVSTAQEDHEVLAYASLPLQATAHAQPEVLANVHCCTASAPASAPVSASSSLPNPRIGGKRKERPWLQQAATPSSSTGLQIGGAKRQHHHQSKCLQHQQLPTPCRSPFAVARLEEQSSSSRATLLQPDLHPANRTRAPPSDCRTQQQQQQLQQVATGHLDQPSHDDVHSNAGLFGRLPDEVKLHVFSMLPPTALLKTVPLVCREWYALAYDDGLWRSLFTRHIGGSTTVSPSAVPANRKRRQRRTMNTAGASDLAMSASGWRQSACEVMRQLRLSFFSLRNSLQEQADRHKQEQDQTFTRWLVRCLEWFVDGGHAPLMATFLRDVSRFVPATAIHDALVSRQLKAGSNLILRAVKAGHTSIVALLVIFGAEVGPALVFAAMNQDGPAIVQCIQAYQEVKRTLCAPSRRSCPRSRHLLMRLEGNMQDSMRTCMNIASVGRDKGLLDLLTNLCFFDPALSEVLSFADSVRMDGPVASLYTESDDEYDSEEEDEPDRPV